MMQQYARRRMMGGVSDIYGAEWNYGASSPALTRLADAAGFPALYAPVGSATRPYSDAARTIPVTNPFDSIMPWAGIRVCNMVNGVVTAYRGDAGFSYTTADVMVEIPKFWYRCEDDPVNSLRRWYIANKPTPGFAVHPAFRHNGTEQNYIYVARYATSGSANAQVSKSGVLPIASTTRAAFRGSSATTGARAKGTGWSQWDLAAWNAIQMLYLVEYANFNSQLVIGRGYCRGNALQTNGSTDTMAYHTGQIAGTVDLTPVQYRGLESIYGTAAQYMDGCNVNSGVLYYCTDQSGFADDTAIGYTQIGYTLAPSRGGISKLGFDALHPWLQAPTATGATLDTYVTDTFYVNYTGWRIAFGGGSWAEESGCGMFTFNVNNVPTYIGAGVVSRLLKV